MPIRHLARSAPIALVALAATFNIACSLPGVRPRMAADFAAGETHAKRIALLPVDVSVQVEGEGRRVGSDPALADKLAGRLARGVTRALTRRGYSVTAAIGAHGCLEAGARRTIVIHPADLAALRVEIHQSTAIHGKGPGLIEARVSADLTRQIQSVTGADASLYARGFVYIARGESAGATVLKVLAITLMVVVVVGMLVMLLSGGKGGKSGKSHSRRSSGARVALGATRAVARAVATVGEVALRIAPLALDAAATVHQAHADVPCHRCAAPPPPPGPPPSDMDDLFADEPGIPPEALPAPPAALSARTPPPPGPPPTLMLHDPGKVPRRSTVGLAVTLLQNSSGRVLWHARQDFPVQVDQRYNVEKLVDHFFAGLPAAVE